jgi:hypothetical protein
VVVVDESEDLSRVMPVLRRKRKRKKAPRIVFPLMKPRNSTRTARNSVVTSATVANATSVMSAIILTRPDLQLVTPSPVVHVVDDPLVVVKPKHPDCASISVTTRSVSTETNADLSMVRMINESACKLVHSVKLLGNVTNSVMKVTASSEIDADSLTKRAAMPLTAMLRTQKRTLRRIINF